jgi:hypothetical protein
MFARATTPTPIAIRRARLKTDARLCRRHAPGVIRVTSDAMHRRQSARSVIVIANGKSDDADEDRGFFEADLAGDLASVDGNEYVDSLRAGNVEAIAGTVVLVACVVTSFSLWTLFSSGCGLPPGPFGVFGAAEGVSYLAVAGTVVAATVKKFKTGSGLPAGPGGVLGGAEGVAFLVALVGIGVGAHQLLEYGFVPEAVPTEGGKCFPK